MFVHRYLPPETQVVLVSATLPAEVLEMTSKFMTDPIKVLVKRDELTLEVRHCLRCEAKGRKAHAGELSEGHSTLRTALNSALCLGLDLAHID